MPLQTRVIAALPEEGLKDSSYDTSHGWLAPFVKFTLLQSVQHTEKTTGNHARIKMKQLNRHKHCIL